MQVFFFGGGESLGRVLLGLSEAVKEKKTKPNQTRHRHSLLSEPWRRLFQGVFRIVIPGSIRLDLTQDRPLPCNYRPHTWPAKGEVTGQVFF